MKTQIIISRTNSEKPFYYINTYVKDSINFVISQSSSMINKEQYEILLGDKKEEPKENIFYAEIGN